jgi:hypothetical protein
MLCLQSDFVERKTIIIVLLTHSQEPNPCCDLLLVGMLKDKAYSNISRTESELKESIHSII